jgi:hypothetical protein
LIFAKIIAGLKKLVSIFLVFLILYNMLGYIVVFKSYQYAIRKEVKNRIKDAIPENELTIIRLTTNEVQNGKIGFKKIDEKEFSLSGNLYDIVRSRICGDTTIYYCINDSKEEKLFANLDEHVKRQMDTNGPLRDRANSLLKNLVKQALLYKYSFALPESSVVSYTLTNAVLPKFFNKNIPSPPPKSLI